MKPRQKIRRIIETQYTNQLEQREINLKRQITSLKEQLKKVDLAIFECIQKTHIGPLGKVTDNVMQRVREYSDSIGEQAIVEITGTAPKRKRKIRL